MSVGTGRCPNCGDPDQGSRFCTACGTALDTAVPALRTHRRSRMIWLVVGFVVLLIASGTTGAVIAVTGSSATDAAESVVEPTYPAPASAESAASPASSAVAPVSSAAMAVVPAAASLNPTMIVLDASSSMKEDDAPGPRIDAAKKAASSLVDGLPNGSPVGLIVYGASTDDSDAAKAAGCQDIKTLVSVAPADKAAFAAAVNGVAASGYTPLGSSLRTAAAALPASGSRNIVVVSDGDDTCQPPAPCDVAKEIAADGLTIHTVGFRVSGSAKDTLTCIAEASGGKYVDAANATQLQAFLRTAVDPNATVNTLTHDGFGDMKVGMSVAQAKSIDPSVDAPPTGAVVVEWRDCDLTFTDGVLVSIEPHHDSSTQDGLAVGDDATKATELYGSSTVQTDDGRTHAVFAAEPDSELGYDITFTPSTPGQLAGSITRILLCLCEPASSTTSSSATPDGRVQTVTPFFSDGRVRLPLDTGNYSNVTVGYCGQTDVAQSAGIYQCGSVADHLPACWPSGSYLYCMHGPADATVVRIWAGTSLPAASEPNSTRPWQIVLADGSRCDVRLGGAWDKPPDGYYYTYSCDGNFAALLAPENAPTLDTSGSTWTVTAQVDWGGPVRTVEVAQITYAGVAPIAPAAQTGDACPSAADLQSALEPGQTISPASSDGIKCLDDWATSAYRHEGNAFPGLFQKVNGQWRSVARETACPLPSPIPVSLYQICQVS